MSRPESGRPDSGRLGSTDVSSLPAALELEGVGKTHLAHQVLRATTQAHGPVLVEVALVNLRLQVGEPAANAGETGTGAILQGLVQCRAVELHGSRLGGAPVKGRLDVERDALERERCRVRTAGAVVSCIARRRKLTGR